MRVVITDGGRAAAGYRSATLGDCVAPAPIAIVGGLPYKEVYDKLAHINATMPKSKRRQRGAIAKGISNQC